jgi:Nif-specific regulatory protein
VARKQGKLELAHRGTLFLDEVGDLALSLQAKLLRVLQEREFERVGGTRPLRVDLRLVAATNRDLAAAVKAGSFRDDLYYRLDVVSISLPPLRERREDIPLLAGYFAARHARRMNRAARGISPEARSCLLAYDWPGNVRELENAIERAVVLGAGDVLRPEDLPESVLEAETASQPPPTRYHEALNEAKRRLIVKAMEEAGGRVTEAARSLGLHPNYLHRLLRNLDLRSALRR